MLKSKPCLEASRLQDVSLGQTDAGILRCFALRFGMELQGYILTGGKSTRFGDEDKALATIGGVSLVERVAESIGKHCQSIHLVKSSVQNYEHLNYPTLVDRLPGLGPLGGIDTALTHAGPEQWAFVCACDLSLMGTSWLPSLLAALDAQADAVVFKGTRYEPLFTLYHGRIGPVVRRQIEQGHLAPHRLFGKINTTALEMPRDWPREPSFNTRESLEAFNK